MLPGKPEKEEVRRVEKLKSLTFISPREPALITAASFFWGVGGWGLATRLVTLVAELNVPVHQELAEPPLCTTLPPSQTLSKRQSCQLEGCAHLLVSTCSRSVPPSLIISSSLCV